MQIHVSVLCCAASVVCVCWYNETCAQTLSSLEVCGLNYHCKEEIPEVFNIVLSNLLIKKSTSTIQIASASPLSSYLKLVLPSLSLQLYLGCG